MLHVARRLDEKVAGGKGTCSFQEALPLLKRTDGRNGVKILQDTNDMTLFFYRKKLFFTEQIHFCRDK